MEENKTAYIAIDKDNTCVGRLGTSCIICDNFVPLTEEEEMLLRYGHNINSKVCDDCKQAIAHIKKIIAEGKI